MDVMGYILRKTVILKMINVFCVFLGPQKYALPKEKEKFGKKWYFQK